MANPRVGSVPCPFCGAAAEVRQYARGSRAYYFACREGIIRPATAEGQDWLLEHMRLDSPADPSPPPSPEPTPTPKPEPSPATSSWLDAL